MPSKDAHKKDLLQKLSVLLAKDDDFRNDEDGLDGPDYERWDKARNELVAEFDRRGK
jgi:hypothetical protein